MLLPNLLAAQSQPGRRACQELNPNYGKVVSSFYVYTWFEVNSKYNRFTQKGKQKPSLQFLKHLTTLSAVLYSCRTQSSDSWST